MRVLIAEDEPRIAGAVARGLRREGMAVDVAGDGASALYKARVVPYDVVVLDRDLPEVHGDDVCRALAAELPGTKVLMLTAARSTDDLVSGLSLGADDYLPKPFRFAELVARVRALARRAGGRAPARAGGRGRRARPGAPHGDPRAAARSTSPPKEFAVLEVLLAAQGGVVGARRAGRARVGRAARSAVEHRAHDGDDAAPQARGPAAGRDGPRERLPRVSTTALRIRLTALYGGLFVVFVALLMAVSYWLMSRHLGRTLPPEEASASLAQLGTQYAIALAGATLVASALGWALAGRELASAEAAFAARERFAANAGHELRSPLTVIRTEVDVTLADPGASAAELRAMGEGVLETVDRMDGLLDGLMLLVRAGRPLPHTERVDLAAVAAAAARRAGARAVSLRLDLHPAAVRGAPALLERLAENLVENGVRYNAPGGFVTVTTGARDGEALLRVVNSGPPVPAETAARLLEPFERGGRARDDRGAGLGLSIVRSVAEAHGGRVSIGSRAEGGLAVDVVLPRA